MCIITEYRVKSSSGTGNISPGMEPVLFCHTERYFIFAIGFIDPGSRLFWARRHGTRHCKGSPGREGLTAVTEGRKKKKKGRTS